MKTTCLTIVPVTIVPSSIFYLPIGIGKGRLKVMVLDFDSVSEAVTML